MDEEPTIRPSTPKPAPTTKAAPKAAGPGPAAADPFQFWSDYYQGLKADDALPAELFRTVAPLIQSKDPDHRARDHAHAEAAIKSYLRWHGKQAEPWMYEWLVKMIEERKGTEPELKTALGFAAVLAKRSGNPIDLIRIADMLVVRRFYGPVGQPGFETNIGELVDQAAEKEPTNAYAPMMSVNLAMHDKDPKRMADAAERLLSLGWPGFDDKMRRDVKEQVRILEKDLREDGRTAEADALMARLADSEARDLYVKLTWVGEADVDVSVDEPLGATAGYRNPRTVFGGAIVKNGYGHHPEEVYVCPRGFDGDYTIRVAVIYNDGAKPVTEATLEVITHEGTAGEQKKVSKINLARPTPVVVNLTGGRRKVVLPFIAPPQRPAVAEKEKARPKAAPAPIPADPLKPSGSRPLPIR